MQLMEKNHWNSLESNKVCCIFFSLLWYAWVCT